MNGGVREKLDAKSRRLTTRKRRLGERERKRDCLFCCHSDPSCHLKASLTRCHVVALEYYMGKKKENNFMGNDF